MIDATSTHAPNPSHSLAATPVSSHAITPHASAGTIGDCPSFHAATAQPRYNASAETLAITASCSKVLLIASASVRIDCVTIASCGARLIGCTRASAGG